MTTVTTPKKNSYDPGLDPAFQRPVIEVDEWRERFLPDGTRLPFRYMRGGFSGTEVRFRMLFPERESCRMRFHQCLTSEKGEKPDPVSEEAALALKSGACYMELTPRDEISWKACAAVAELGRKKAREIYGPDRFYGYVYGADGTAYQALACVENASAWDGAAMVVSGAQTILYDASDPTRFALAGETAGIPNALSALENWVERGVRPA